MNVRPDTPRQSKRPSVSAAPLLLTIGAATLLALPAVATTAAEVGGCAGTVPSTTLTISPSTPNYNSVVDSLLPGQRLVLEPGTYLSGLRIQDLAGEEDNCIVIEGDAALPRPRLEGIVDVNTVRIRRSKYVVIRHLELDGLGRNGDGVKAEGDADNWAHHITLEDLYIHGHGADQQIVGINTKCEVWNLVIRRNIIEEAGTGIYLGNSDGEDELVNGLIEYNLIVDTIGYNMQVKHQENRVAPDPGGGDPGMPEDGTTIIRHNVFSKANNASTGLAARPNLLVGHFPPYGSLAAPAPGSMDDYLVYGNFFHHNASQSEGLFQGTGNVIFYDNLLVNVYGGGAFFASHEDGDPQRVRAFQNTVVVLDDGIWIASGADPDFEQIVLGNAVFAGFPLTRGTQLGNVAAPYLDATGDLQNPFGSVSNPDDRLDLYPRSDSALDGAPLDTGDVDSYEEWDRDFNDRSRPGIFRGAYAGEGTNPGWLPALERKPDGAIFADGFESGDASAWGS